MIRLALQGIHDSRKEVKAYEVLARMECPRSGKLYSPSDFKTVSPLSWQDIDIEVLSLLSRSRELAGMLKPVFINISHETLSCTVTMKTCSDLIRRLSNQFAGDIVVEIPESTSIKGSELSRILEHLEDTGAMVAIDDFGSINAVMDRLDSHAWDYCKVDLDSFRESDNLDWLIQLKNKCTTRNIKVVFERLESVRDKDIISIIPDAWIQGFAYSRPKLANLVFPVDEISSGKLSRAGGHHAFDLIGAI